MIETNGYKIPLSWIDGENKFRKNLHGTMSICLMFHLLGVASECLAATAITKGSFIKTSMFLKSTFGDKKFGGSYYRRIRNGLTQLLNAKIIREFRLEDKHILVTFTNEFLYYTYEGLPVINFKIPCTKEEVEEGGDNEMD